MSSQQVQHSLQRIGISIQTIEDLAPQEQKRESMKRRKKMEQAYATLSLHAGKLGIEIPRLSTFYRPELELAQKNVEAKLGN